MKIAVVSDAVHPWHLGGKETRWYENVKKLREQGFDVTIYSMRWWEGKDPYGHVGLMKNQPMYKQDGGRSMKQAFLFSLACFKLLFVKTDLIDADQMPGPQLLVLYVVAKIKRVPLVVTWLEYWGEEGWRKYLKNLWFLGYYIENLGTKTAGHIIAITDDTAEGLIKSGVKSTKITTILTGVDARARVVSKHRSGFVTFGRLAPHKRVDIAIKTISELNKQGIDKTLTIIGDGPEREKLMELAGKLGVLDKVLFVGALENKQDVWDKVAESEVCLMPSEREGFGIAVAEALILGTPVVLGDGEKNASRHLVEHQKTGWVATCGEVASYVEGARQILGGNYVDVSSEFLRKHPDFTWEGCAQKTGEIYKEMVYKHGKKTA